jgi:thioester reductase-like protein
VKKLLITGATGFLGGELLKQLTPYYEHVYILCREQSMSKIQSLQENQEVLIGDITEIETIQSIQKYEEVLDNVTHILHAAAAYCLGDDDPTSYTSNVIGTQNICNLANKINNLKSFDYISTYAVNSPFATTISEDYLEQDLELLLNPYSRSKNLSEKYVKNFTFIKEIKVTTYRPGIIIGSSETGEIPKVDGPYYLFSLLRKIVPRKVKGKLILPLPFKWNATIPMIPVDTCAQIITQISLATSQSNNKTYHILCKKHYQIRDLIKKIFKLNSLKIIPLPLPRSILNKQISKLLHFPESLLTYFYSCGIFSTENLRSDFPKLNRDYTKEIDSALSKYKEN